MILVEAADESSWYAIISARTLEQVKGLTKKLMAIPSVGRVESVLDFIPSRQAEKSADEYHATGWVRHLLP